MPQKRRRWREVKLKRDPFPLIFTHGDAMTQLACLAFLDLADAPQGNACLAKLLKQQRADGAFPSQLDPMTWGMQETVRHTLLLLKVGMPATGVNVNSAVRFVLRNQNPNGGWCENPALEIPPGHQAGPHPRFLQRRSRDRRCHLTAFPSRAW